MKHFCLLITICFIISIFVSPAISKAASPDAYEEDDMLRQASIIVLNNNLLQHHNFHDAGDEDWVKFYGISGQAYSVKVSNAGTKCNAVIELYRSDNTLLLDPVNDFIEGEGEDLALRCPEDGIYYAKTYNYNPAVLGGTEYDLSIFRPHSCVTGMLIGAVIDASSNEPVGNAIIKGHAVCRACA
ncbi:MAG: hypothetical protein GY749_18670 [Desulfobacteraceae bacterium]|nr:hypothetical protein [Desulfobacteraceae bacterium]